MQGVIKVNFNNAKIKKPTLDKPVLAWKNNTTLLISHSNLSKFDTCKMIISIDNQEPLETFLDSYEYTDSSFQNKESISVNITLEGTHSLYTIPFKATYNMDVGIRCSDIVVCSEQLYCQD